jgi:CHASE2 domain-containing sensor protein
MVGIDAGPGAVVLGIALLVIGAYGATRLQATRGPLAAALALAPFGVLIGAGAALVRGWDLVPTTVAGALLVPFVALAGRSIEARRRRGRA